MTSKCLRQTGIIAEGWNQIKLSCRPRAGVRCAGSLVSAEKDNVTSSAKICSGEEVIPNSCPGQNPHTKSHQEKHHFLFTLWKETIVSAHELSTPLPAASSTHKGSNSYRPQKQSTQGDSRILRWALKSQTPRWQGWRYLCHRMLAAEHPSSLTPNRVWATGGQARHTLSHTLPLDHTTLGRSTQTPQQVEMKSFWLLKWSHVWLLKASWQPENPNLNTPHNVCQWPTF